MKHLLQWLRTHTRLLWKSLRDTVPLLFSLIRSLCALLSRLLCRCCRRHHLPERERRRSPHRCASDQRTGVQASRSSNLLAVLSDAARLGRHLDNPGIQLYHNGTPVPSSALDADTEYDVVARVWNILTNRLFRNCFICLQRSIFD
jgi:hypothetical protein